MVKLSKNLAVYEPLKCDVAAICSTTLCTGSGYPTGQIDPVKKTSIWGNE